MSSKNRCFYKFAGFRLDPETCLLWLHDHLIPLEPKVAKTLLVLVSAQGELVTKEELIQTVWEGIAVTDDSLTRNVSLLRRILSKDPTVTESIRNIPKRGYCFILPIVEQEIEEIERAHRVNSDKHLQGQTEPNNKHQQQ